MEDALWIAKFATRGDTLNFPRIEYGTMKLAERCGIQIPEVRALSVGDKDIFLTRRFDRRRSAAGCLRLGFLSSLSLMEWDRRDRLVWSYPVLAAGMRRHTSAEDLHELFRRMVFNILVRNTDDHPKNHGFLVNGTDISLSPAYDIVPSIAREGVSTSFQLAMTVGDTGRDATPENALSQCGQFGLSQDAAKAIVDELHTVCSGWRDHYADHGLSPRDIDLLAPSFAWS
jgi:serine/threonine-protein kinase HipA